MPYYPDKNGFECIDRCDCSIGKICRECAKEAVCIYSSHPSCKRVETSIKYCKYHETRWGDKKKDKCGECEPGFTLLDNGDCDTKCYENRDSGVPRCGNGFYCKLNEKKEKKEPKKAGICTKLVSKKNRTIENCKKYKDTESSSNVPCSDCKAGYFLNEDGDLLNMNKCEKNCKMLPINHTS